MRRCHYPPGVLNLPRPKLSLARLLSALGITGVLLLCPRLAAAGPINFSADEGADIFGHIDQNALGDVLGDCGCGPVAAVNSFIYLENKFPFIYGTMLTPLVTVEEQKVAGNLALNYMSTNAHSEGKTFIGDFIDGKRNYIDDNAPFTTIFSAQVNPKLVAGDGLATLKRHGTFGSDRLILGAGTARP